MNNIIKHEEQQSDMAYFKQLCKNAMQTGKYPQEMNEATMLNIMLTAKDLGISPMKAINGGFYIVNGKISMSTNLMIDRIRAEGHSIKIIEWTREKCVLIGKRRDNEDSCKVEYTMEDAQLAGLLNSPTWKKHPKAMLSARAHSMLARVLFPDVVGNAYSEDEAQEIAGIPAHKRPDVDPEEMPMATVEIIEKPKIEEKCPTIDDLSAELVGLGTECDVSMLQAFVKLMATKHNRTEEAIIKSALVNKDQLGRFNDSFLKSLEEKKTHSNLHDGKP